MMPHVIRNENPAYYDPESTLVMDSKVLFDALDNDLPQDDRKSALEVPIIEEFMRRAMCRPRWCPHNEMQLNKVQGSAFGAVVHVATHWNVYVERRKIRVGGSCNSTTSWNCSTTQSERSQISDGTSFFCSYTIGLR